MMEQGRLRAVSFFVCLFMWGCAAQPGAPEPVGQMSAADTKAATNTMLVPAVEAQKSLTKASVYTSMTEIDIVPDYQVGWIAAAACTAPGDVLLSGGCDGASEQTAPYMITASLPYYISDGSKLAQWACTFQPTFGSVRTKVRAYAVCLSTARG